METALGFHVEVDAQGAQRVNGLRVTDDELRGAAQAARAKERDVRALVRADRAASWAQVIHTIDLLKSAGIDKLGFIVEAAPALPPVQTASAAPVLAPMFPPPPLPPEPVEVPPSPSAAGAPRRAKAKSGAWACAFPKQAGESGVDEATVTIIVSVAADGQVTAAQIVGEAKDGFGPAALRCALDHAYEPATNGRTPVAGQTPPIKIRFIR